MSERRFESNGDHFEALVLGSGFGGAVVAYRLAAAGKTVCLLERGKAYPPGSFARTPFELHHNFWRPSKNHHGLFDVWAFGSMNAVVSAGLGGGSLIYANVLLRKDERWFVHHGAAADAGEDWPLSRADLEPHYDRVERMLRPEIYPREYQRDNKTAAMREAARTLRIPETTYDHIDATRAQFFLPPLAVTFRDAGGRAVRGAPIAGTNLHGALRETCRLCGECDIGCNYGSKNTLDFTYLSAAQERGAEIRTLCEAESIAPVRRAGRAAYRVEYTVHDDVEHRKERCAVTADRVIVACGTLGSTLLLMRSGGKLPGLSPVLGHRFGGNGDYLAFARQCTRRGKLPWRREARPLNASRAPVITSTFRFPDARDGAGKGKRGGYLQDAGYPLAGDYLWEMLDTMSSLRRVAVFAWQRIVAPRFGGPAHRQIGDQIETLIGTANASLASMPLLAMGRDLPDGLLRLDRRRRLDLRWRALGSKPWYRRAERESRKLTRALGGRFSGDPLTTLFNEEITVHPLGGAPMGRDAERGVVDAYGRVFGWPGLYVTDGAAMPGPIGANPSLTIAAFADRCAERMLDDWT